MEFSVHCPHCGGRTTADSRDSDIPGYVICPYCRRKIPLKHGAEDEPPKPADGS